MNIRLHQVHIQNLRSIQETNILMQPFSVLFGKNDSGKSNFLLALNLAFGNGSINDKDVFCSADIPYDKESNVIIDLKFIPIDNNGKQTDTFNDLWAMHLGDSVMIDADDKEFFAYRTEFSFDADREEYVRDRATINEWEGNSIKADALFRYSILSAFDFEYIDAHRDMADDIRDKNSMWSKEISKLKIPSDAKGEIETSLGKLSDRILEESPFLQQVSKDLTSVINDKKANVTIDPVTRSVDELYKGLDIFVSQSNSSSIPISNLGQGTRSRAVFSSMKSIINRRISEAVEKPYFCMIAFEEPESHIHPHAQRELVKDFSRIQAQRIVTTHSPYILTSSELLNLYYVAIHNAKTQLIPLSSLELQQEELRRINRCVLNTRGELLFSDIVVLAEGETEEQSLPIFFKEFFDCEPYELGVSFVGVGGKNYLPFLRMLKCIDTPWFIFSDGETSAISELQSKMKQLYELQEKPDLSQYKNIIVLDNSNDFETYLLDSGYADEIVSAINDYEDSLSYFDKYIAKHDGEGMKERSTNEICEKCGQKIWEKPFRDYHSEGGREQAIKDCMKDGKTKYAVPISEKICSICTEERRFPPKIKTLFEQIEKVLEG